MATSRAKPNLPVNYAEQLAQEAAVISSRIAAPTGNHIRFNANRGFITPDGMEGDELEVVIVEFMSRNTYYDRDYDKDNPSPPACFAIGPEPSMLMPSPRSPNKQCETCTPCQQNQFGSATVGKGKGCKNTRLLALMPLSALDKDDAPIWIMAVPPASLKSFDAYVHSLAHKHKTVPIGVVTRIAPDPKSTFAAPRFSVHRPLTTKELGTFMGRREEAADALATEPDVSGYTPSVTKGVGRGRR